MFVFLIKRKRMFLIKRKRILGWLCFLSWESNVFKLISFSIKLALNSTCPFLFFFHFICTDKWHVMGISQFIRVIYYQLKQGLQKDCSDTNSGSTLLDDSWFSADSFLHRLFKVRDLGASFCCCCSFFILHCHAWFIFFLSVLLSFSLFFLSNRKSTEKYHVVIFLTSVELSVHCNLMTNL